MPRWVLKLDGGGGAGADGQKYLLGCCTKGFLMSIEKAQKQLQQDLLEKWLLKQKKMMNDEIQQFYDLLAINRISSRFAGQIKKFSIEQFCVTFNANRQIRKEILTPKSFITWLQTIHSSVFCFLPSQPITVSFSSVGRQRVFLSSWQSWRAACPHTQRQSAADVPVP